MNVTKYVDSFNEAFTKNFISFTLGCIVISINGGFVYTYFKSEVFQRDPRYMLYIHLVINDMIMLTFSVVLQIMTYTITLSVTPCCIMLMILITTAKISPLNLASMALERYIAICRPLHHAQICTVRRAYALIALMWAVSVLPVFTDIIIIFVTQPLSFFTRNVLCYSFNVFNTPFHKLHREVVQVLLLSSVFLTLIVTYLKVICVARSVSGSQKASARSALNTILLHGVQLLLCMLSYITPLINLMLVSTRPQERTKIFFSTFLFANVFPRLLSPLIYGVRDKKFNSHIRLHICWRCSNSVKRRVKVTARYQRWPKQLRDCLKKST